MTFTKEAIAVVAFFLGVAVAGSYVYVQEEQERDRAARMQGMAAAGLPACVPKADGRVDDEEVLERIIVWGELMAPRTAAAAKRVEDDKVSELLTRDAKRLREDAAQAKKLYQSITGKAYVAADASPNISLPTEDGYKDAALDVVPNLFRGYMNFAQREIYTAASASSNPDVRSIGRRYLVHAGETVFAMTNQ